MKGFSAGWVRCPIDGGDSGLLWPLLRLLNQGCVTLRLLHGSGRVGQIRGNETGSQVLVQQRTHTGRRNERREKILIQAAAPDDVEMFVANRQGTHHGQRQGDAIGQLLFI